jgi:hypothetical protein
MSNRSHGPGVRQGSGESLGLLFLEDKDGLQGPYWQGRIHCTTTTGAKDSTDVAEKLDSSAEGFYGRLMCRARLIAPKLPTYPHHVVLVFVNTILVLFFTLL